MSVARYQAIRTELEAQIQSGELPPGARLPTEAELQEAYDVSRATAQKALNELAQAGLVVRTRRKGTHVASGARQVNLLRYLDPAQGKSGAPEIPGRHAVISAEVIPAAKAEVELPGIDPATPVTQMVRLKYDVDENPIVVEIAAIPFALAPDLLSEELTHLTTRAYLNRLGIAIPKSRMYFDAVLLEQRNADLLAIEPGQPVLRRRRLMWQTNGQIAEAAVFFVRPETIDFYIEYSDPE
ncbi:GntR family transcriptional regulator [Micromonospora sp. B11E3]|uniref:GntR family transcriptional regulator n=1 Tax=unclassified Micromonospora TaxID=2617518 RepID=UPI00325F47AA